MNQLDSRERETYSRQLVLPFFGETGQINLKKKKIAICGVGGLGANSALLIAKMGAGFIRLIDRDLVEQSNLPRTPLYSLSDIDTPKVEAAKKKLLELVPDINIEPFATNIDMSTIDDLLDGIDFVIDGLDAFKPRYAINLRCFEKKIPYFFAGAQAYSANISTFTYRERNLPCLTCIFPDIDDLHLPTCEITGVHPAILSISTAIQISELTKIVGGKSPQLEGKMLFYDLASLSQDVITFKKNPKCQTCSEESKKGPKNRLKDAFIMELCGKNSYMVVPPEEERSIVIKETAEEFKKSGLLVTKQNKYGLSIKIPGFDHKLSIFQGGNVLIRGASTAEEAREAYMKIAELLIIKRKSNE
ncbi:MAG: ThiF family adenylyltransferase [Candidatus Odinarchaeota archaeon]